MANLNFCYGRPESFLQSSVSHDISEIILICRFAALETLSPQLKIMITFLKRVFLNDSLKAPADVSHLFMKQITPVVLYDCSFCRYTVFYLTKLNLDCKLTFTTAVKYLWWFSFAEKCCRKHWLRCYVKTICFYTDGSFIHLWQITFGFIWEDYLLHLII